MAFLKKSLSEDSIDRYSHTWTFLFFLLLSMICLFVTLSPSMTLTQPKSSFKPAGNSTLSKTSAVKMGEADPRYKADCWVPAQFSRSGSAYTNAICASALNSLVQGQNFSGASLYKPPESPVPFKDPGVLSIKDFLIPKEDSVNQTNTESSEDQRHEELRTKSEFLQLQNEKLQSDVQEMASFRVPMSLFLLAICLRLPHAVWSILSTCCGSFNVDQTLAVAQNVQSMDPASQQRIKEEIALTVGKSSKKSTGLLYLLMKVLMVIVICMEVIGVNHGLRKIDELEDDAANVKIYGESVMRLSRFAQNKDGSNTEALPSLKKNFPESETYFCDFAIRQLQRLDRYTVQCVFTKMEARLSINGKSPSEIQPSGVMTEEKILLLYKALLTIVLATLVILAFCNITSLIAWLLKLLMTSSRQRLGLKTDASFDMMFLVSMAQYNTSAIVVTDLTKYSVWSDGSGYSNQGESLRLKDDVADS